MALFSNLFIDGVKYEKDDVKNKNIYPFNISSIESLDKLTFSKPVTFLIGENGAGKSTFIEALAIRLRLNPEGGSQNIVFKTTDSHSNLSDYLTVYSSGNLPKTKYFLRAESFYNVAADDFNKINYKDTDIYKTYKMFLEDPDSMQERLYNNE